MAQKHANIDLKAGNVQTLNQEVAKAKILDAAMEHMATIGINRTHFGLTFGLVWEE